jgi:hypothetical protein
MLNLESVGNCRSVGRLSLEKRLEKMRRRVSIAFLAGFRWKSMGERWQKNWTVNIEDHARQEV